MIDCNCIYTRGASSESCNDNKRGACQASNAISNGSGRVAADCFGSRFPVGPEGAKRKRVRRRRSDCHRKNRPLRETTPLNCWLLILILTVSFLSEATDCADSADGWPQHPDGDSNSTRNLNENGAKHQLWLKLLSSLLAPELGPAAPDGTGSGSGPSLEHLASRLANWPSQQRASLFYLDLLERRRASGQLLDSAACRRVSLAELASDRIPAELIDNKTSSTTLAAGEPAPAANADDVGGGGGGETAAGSGRGSGPQEGGANWAQNRMRAWAQLNEVSDSALLGKLNLEPKFADGAKLAVENANIISRLLIHPESQVIIGIASQQNFFKYLLESKVRQLASSGNAATQLLHSAGLIFFDAYDEPAGSDGGDANEPAAADQEDQAADRNAEYAYNDAPDRHLTLTPTASVATNNRPDERAGLGEPDSAAPGSRSLDGIGRAIANGNGKATRNKLRSSFGPQAVLNYGTQSADDFSIRLYDLAKHPIAGDANSPNGYFRPETSFLSRWLVARDEMKLIELTERLNNLLELPEKWADVGKSSAREPEPPSELEDSKFSLRLEDGRWFSPYFDCGVSNRWLLTYSLPFFASSKTRNPHASNNTSNRNNKDKRSIKLRGASFVSLDLGRSRLLDQCAPTGSPGFLANTHQCARLHQSRCLRLADFSEIRSGGYVCQCPGKAAPILASSERLAVQAHREYLSELIIANSINATRALDQLALADLDDKLADKGFVGKQLAGQLASARKAANRKSAAQNSPATTNNRHDAAAAANRNKLINAPQFALGAQLELDAALEWFARAKPEEAQPAGLDRWPRQVCRLCKWSNASRPDSGPAEPVSGWPGAAEELATCDELPGATLAGWIRRLVLLLQSLCALLTLALIAILLRVRKSRIILVSGWLMLETTLIGALLLYTSVFVRCFEPTSLTCLLEPWLRELGFSVFYGSIMIKLYRILTEFQTRKAHRVCLRDKDQMVYLLAIVLIVVGYMSAWTALMVDGFFLGQQHQQPAEAELPGQLDPAAEAGSGANLVQLHSLDKGKPFYGADRFRRATNSPDSFLLLPAEPGITGTESAQLGAQIPTGAGISKYSGRRDVSSILNYSGTDTFAGATSAQSELLQGAGLTVAERLPEQLKIFVKRLNSFSDLFSGLLEADQQYDDWSDSLTYSMRCRKLTWDYVTEISEMGLLFFGIYLIYKLRNASSEVHKEKLVLSAAIFIELFISALAYAIRHALWNQLSSEQILALYCLRCHLTVTLTLALIFGPKLWTIGKSRPTFFSSASRATGSSMRHRCHITCELHDHHLNDAMRLHQAMLSNSALDIGSINLADMDPDEIQAELKRVYAQLEVLKTKVMRRDNPHISKRRGGRKQGHRKFSLQAFHAKHIASAVGGSHHNASSPQTSTETAHSLESSNQANNNNNQNNSDQQQMIIGATAAGKKLSVLLEHEANNEEPTEAEGSFRAAQREKVRMIATGAHPAARQSAHRQHSANLNAAGRLQQANNNNNNNNRFNQPASGKTQPTAASSKRPAVLADPVSSSSAGVYFDDDTLILNDSPSSENVSTQRQSSFVCSQSSIHPE